MIVEELVARIGLDFTGASAAASAVNKLTDIKKAALGIGGVFVALKGALTAVTVSVAETVDAYSDFGNAVGASVETIETLTAAAEMNSGSFDDVRLGLKTLTDQAGAAAKGNETAGEAFTRLGVNVRQSNGHIKTADQLLADVADGLSKMSDPASQVNAAVDLLGRGAIRLLPALTNGKKGLTTFRAEMERIGVVMSESTNKRFVKLGDNLDMLKLRATSLKNIFALEFLPTVEKMVQGLNSLFESNIGRLREFGRHVTETLVSPFELLGNIFQALPGWMQGVVSAGIALTAIFVSPAVAIIALAGLIALIADDINHFLKGQPSLIGEVVKEWQNFLQVFRDIDDQATGLIAVFTKLGRVLADVAGLFSSRGSKRQKALDDLLDTTGLTAVSDSVAGGINAGIMGVAKGIITLAGDDPSKVLPPNFTPGSRRSLSSQSFLQSATPLNYTPGPRQIVHAPQITVQASGLTAAEAQAMTENALLQSALEISDISGARK